MALVRVYCGLASADESVRGASAAQLTIAVVDDAGRLLGVHEISDDPGGYAELGALLVERTSGFTDAAVAADSDDHLVTSLLTAAGRPLAVADDDTADDFAERFADDDSVEEMQAPPAARRAVGLARALQAGALVAGNLPVPRDLVSYKPVLAAHVALLSGRHAAATALREVLRELYPAALRAYPDPSHPLALAVLDALPEPGRLSAHGEPQQIAEQVAVELTRAGDGTEDEIISAVTALQVAISESPRRGGVNKSLAPAAGETVRQAVASVRAGDAACAALIGTIAARSALADAGRRTRRAEAAPLSPASGDTGRFGRRNRPEPATTGTGPVIPQPLTKPPVAPAPVMPPPLAPRPVTPPPAAPAASLFPNRATAPGNRPVSVPPPPPGMTPITPGSRPASRTSEPPTGTVFPAASVSPAAASPSSGAPNGTSPADTGQPFRATITNAAINSVRAERQRTVIPPRPSTRSSAPTPDAADFSLPMPSQRPAQETPEPGSRANWPLINSGNDEAATTPAASASSPPSDGRVRPPWQDMPKEPPALRLVDGQLDTTVTDLSAIAEPPPLRLVEGRNGTRRSPSTTNTKLTALDRSTTPPVAADSSDGDLLIFAAARSAWFTGHTEAASDKLDWTNPNDTGWRAAEKASTPEVAAETAAGLPKRVPQANLVPGSPLRDERPLRIVRDAASIAAHTTGYFRGWRRGQEIGGFAMGGRPGREAAGGWDFTRDREGADDFRNNGASNNAGYGSR
ncbi:transposase [Actinoplanes sp. M2I2]|uniref:transposase n=1 Tax=Actinoplanes sp. M2I2 TaxID=1734444 RepID=UPI002021CC49|nr:transposase [Actinoplanes sp. M2I2]